MAPISKLPSTDRIAELIAPFYADAAQTLLAQLRIYLDLLLRWNARTNLTAIRDPEQIVVRHFGESLFVAHHLAAGAGTLLDYGSGAGFPGLPVQLARPELAVTLAESQVKKASFLREVVRTLGLQTEVWAGRAETLDRTFDVVALRAVDNPTAALRQAAGLVIPGGMLAHLTVEGGKPGLRLQGASSTFLPFPVQGVFHVEH